MSWRRGVVALCGGLSAPPAARWGLFSVYTVPVTLPRAAAAAAPRGATDMWARGAKTSASDTNDTPLKKPKKNKARPPSPYTMFVKQQWQQLTAAGGLQVSFKEAAQEVRERWRSISPEARAALEVEVEKARENWVEPPPPEPKKKKNLSAYNCFVKERLPELRAGNTSTKIPDLMRAASVEWKSLPDNQRAIYQAMADQFNGKH